MKISVVVPKFFKKENTILGCFEITDEELIKHNQQRLTLVLNKMTQYMLNNAKQDKVITDLLENLTRIQFITDQGMKINLLDID